MSFKLNTCLFFLLAVTGLHAQIMITSEDLPSPGEQLVFYQDTVPDGVEAGPAGSGQAWDFSGLVADRYFSNRLFVPDEVPDSQQFPEADFVLQADSTFLFAQLSEEGLFNLGARVSNELLDTSFLVRYNPAQKVLELPTALGTSFQQTYNFFGAIDGSFFSNGIFDSLGLIRTIREEVQADAEGMVTTPGGSYDALRLQVDSETVDSIYGQSFGIWIFISALESVSKEYRWVAKGGKGNVLSIFADEFGDVIKADWLQNVTTNSMIAPEADFVIAGQNELTVTFTDLSTNEPSAWLWDFGDGNFSTEQNPVHTYATTDTFTVCLRAINDAGFDIACSTLDALVSSILDLEEIYGFQLYPNPVDKALRVRLEKPVPKQWFLEFSDASGRIHTRIGVQDDARVQTADWTPGLHFWTVSSENGTVIGSGKIMKHRSSQR